MITQPLSEQENFQAFLGELYNQIEDGETLQKIRQKAWSRFLELGLPQRKDEVFQYVRLKSFFSSRYQSCQATDISQEKLDPYILPECRQSVFVFVNGFFNSNLSRIEALPKRLIALPLKDAMQTYGGFLNNRWANAIKEENDPFAILNSALHSDGLFLYLPPKTIVDKPIQILNIADASDRAMLIMPRLQLLAGLHSELSLVSTQDTLSGDSFVVNIAADIVLEEGARIKFKQIACRNSKNIWHFDALRAVLKRNSFLQTVSITDGAATVRNDYRIALAGENSEAHLNGTCMLAGKNEAHTHVLIEHQAPFARSMQLFKGVLADVSRSSFEGKILVRQLAQKTEAFQLNNNLLLSDYAHADSKPNLEIFADDVKASHGATVGQLDKEQIFYMKTRGFSDVEAKHLLVYGFCKEVIDLIDIPSLHDAMQVRARAIIQNS